MAGYSGTPLQKKLGIKSGFEMAVFNEPADYWDLISPLPEKIKVVKKPKACTIDFAHIFVKEMKVFEKEFARYRDYLKKDGMLWVSWPKKASKVATDLDETKVREFGLENGLVDIKVCAVDEVWSGHKFVYRVKDR
jgi:hypothetical protein